MINILMPMAGKSQFFDTPEYQFPKPLIEINGKSMIEWVIDNYKNVKEKKRFIFVVNDADCAKYHLDNVLKLLTDDTCEIVRLSNDTKGAVCSTLMAIDFINNDDKLVITNSDQIINENINKILDTFDKQKADAGVVCFETVHPRWSYVKVGEDDQIIEAAEKRPISKNAIAGFYYFTKGKHFVDAGMKLIEKDASVNGIYYVAPTFNELILKNMSLKMYKIDREKYHTFYSPQKISEFEQSLRKWG